jgi:hypothetical protein
VLSQGCLPFRGRRAVLSLRCATDHFIPAR